VTSSYIDEQVWQAAQPISFSDDAAIYKYWCELRRSGQYLGVPVTPEIQTPAGVQQGFASGAVIGWNPDDGAYLASD
jgi:uncharacterized protein with LGFP repeats